MAYKVNRTTKGNTIKTQMDEKGLVVATAVETFDILLEDNQGLEDAVSVRINAPIPRHNDPHPESDRLRVTDIDVQRETVLLYKAVINYQSPKAPSDNEDTPPVELPVEIDWSSVTVEAETTVDVNGNAIVNDGTGEPIFGITREVTDLQGTFTRNFATFNPAAIYLLNKKVNSDNFLGFPPGVARIDSVSASNEIKDDIPFWRVTYVISFRAPYATTAAQAWYKRIPRMGYRVKEGDQIVDAVDDFKQRVTTPVRLSATGTALGPDDPTEFKFVQVHETINFSTLGLF